MYVIHVKITCYKNCEFFNILNGIPHRTKHQNNELNCKKKKKKKIQHIKRYLNQELSLCLKDNLIF